MKRIFFLTLFALLSILTLHAVDKNRNGKSGETGPEFSKFTLGTAVLNGPVTPEQLKGKVVILDFWGVNCGPCLAAMPELVSLDKRLGKKGLQIIGMHCQQASDEEIIKIAEKLRVKFPVTRGGGGPRTGNTIPHICVFDATGKMVFEGHPKDREFEKVLRTAMKSVDPEALKEAADQS